MTESAAMVHPGTLDCTNKMQANHSAFEQNHRCTASNHLGFRCVKDAGTVAGKESLAK
jgi:hypothetical protein